MSAAVTPSFTPDVAGRYLLDLGVTSSAGRSATATVVINADLTAGVVAPIAGFTVVPLALGPGALLTGPRGLVTDGARLRAAQSTAGAIEADAFVLAMATGSVPLARGLGVRLPVYPLKGYSVTVGAATERTWARYWLASGFRKSGLKDEERT